jgi:hypothetical protein
MTVSSSVLSLSALVFLGVVLASTIDRGQETTPFTLQEWWWATKGGFLDLMFAHFIRNGGL